MKRFIVAAACLLALSSSVAHAKVKVVATVSDLGALAEAAGGKRVEVTTLARSTQDPHFVDARHSLIISLANADLLLHVGMDMEAGWLPTLLTSSRNGAIQAGGPGNLNCAILIRPLEVPQEKIERAMGDLHPGGNPHYTKDPRNALLIVRGVAARLAQLDPEHAAEYEANAAKFEAELKTKAAEWLTLLAPFKDKPIITFHRSWSYLSDWSGIQVAGFMEPKPGLPPSLAHVAQVTMLARQRKVKVILQESWYSSQSSQYVADKSGAQLIQVPGAVPEGKRYIDYMDGLVKAVAAGLQGAR